MTSVAMPVFSKKKETLSHGILLGVVGTDVPLVEVMKLALRYKVKKEKNITKELPTLAWSVHVFS